ncbi:hypothetical protein NM208_g2586 [Fusarium decemcellulare]|uniref:Uncharacterized protein n=1 Tax=Fusarium decemcellulare TaxID=57161 RepID=A0ACC1SSA9_9HYPO|nr:hypothetical protein NM208_g2586 [Fusarium decemcellulare]
MAIDDSNKVLHATLNLGDNHEEQNATYAHKGSVVPATTSLPDHLFSTQVYAKIWRVAWQGLIKTEPPNLYPEYTKPGGTRYVYREQDFWTSGFFPGSLYLLLERERKYKGPMGWLGQRSNTPHLMQLEFACKWWTVNLHQNSSLSTTHDLGFMIFPWARPAWELNHDELAYNTIIRASKTLASRYVPEVGAIRSWDTCVTKKYTFTDPKKDFLMIIDNMMNLDMLFWTASRLDDKEMYHIARNHAKRTQEFHIRDDFSTTHVTVFDPNTGLLKDKLTNQGFSHESCWARGQAWAIAGFMQTYNWTQDESFLQTALSCANHFLDQLPPSGIPPWDFRAPRDVHQPPDTSAAVVAIYGMLLIHEALVKRRKQSIYLDQAVRILNSICASHLSPPDEFVVSSAEVDTVEQNSNRIHKQISVSNKDGTPETILGGATINNYEFAPRRWANHGLVYADYYFLLVGNKLLEMGAIESMSNIVI